jgi:phosphatidylglycerol:prolipoprotein diacylglycerol transferase
MLPYLNLAWLGFQAPVSTALVLMLFAIALNAAMLATSLGRGERLKGATIVLLVSVAGIAGGRLMHVLWEQPRYFLDHPGEIFHLDGSAFYGAFFGGLLAAWALVRGWVAPARRGLAWDTFALGLALSVGILRVGCFLEGCCWGSVCFMPWSVTYTNPASSMPYFGIPVHPTQLYNAAAGFALFGLLLQLRRAGTIARGGLMEVFVVGYAITRFATEFFRGDSIRGENVLLSLSTSQVISVALLVAIAGRRLALRLRDRPRASMSSRQRAASIATAVVALAFLAGCLPQPPDQTVIEETVLLSKDMEWAQMSKSPSLELPGGNVPLFPLPIFQEGASGRNLLFVAADSEIQKQFEAPIQRAFNSPTPIRLEEISWWQIAPTLKRQYDGVVRIKWDRFSKESLLKALKLMEQRGLPYDVMLLTHGLPNNLVTSGKNPLISYEDLAKLKGKLPRLGYVFMQACFGDSLVGEWEDAGAKYVISYEGLNRNFFYPEFFLRNLEAAQGDVPSAFAQTNRTIGDELRQSEIYNQVVGALGMTMDEYLVNAPNPSLVARPLGTRRR